jgi:hypothetical protein
LTSTLIASHPTLQLEALDLAHNPMHRELFKFFNSRRASHMTPELTHLDMSHIFSESAIAAPSRILPALTHLSLYQTSMNDAAAHAHTHHPTLTLMIST